MKKSSSILMIVLSSWLLQACHDHGNKAGTEKNLAGQTIMVNEDDSRFTADAFQAGIDEVELSGMAGKKLVDDKLKKFAEMMISDQVKENNELLAIAKSKNVMVTFTLSGDGQQAMDDLNQKTGSDFDKAYAEQMIKDHESEVKLFDDATSNVSDDDLKTFAVKSLPLVKKHLDAIKAIHDGLK